MVEANVGIIYLIFLSIAAPIFFFMLTWAVVTAYRLLVPEQPAPVEQDPVVVRERAAASGVSLTVGVREIREDQRHLQRRRPPAHYTYTFGLSDGVPEVWVEDLWQRRN